MAVLKTCLQSPSCVRGTQVDLVSTVKPDQGPVARLPPVTVVHYLLGDLVLLGPCQTSPCTSSIPMAGEIKGSQILVPLQDTILVRLTSVNRDITYILTCSGITCACSGSFNIKPQCKEFLQGFFCIALAKMISLKGTVCYWILSHCF